MLKIRINLTISKIMAIVIFLTCASYSFYTKDNSVILMAIPITAGMLGFKSYLDSKKNQTTE